MPLVRAVAVALLVAAALPASGATREPARARRAMVATAHPLATEAALRVLKKGGNAVDAAVTAALVLGVVVPFSAGLGGGGFAIVHDAATGRTRALDFRERAPLAAHRDLYLDGQGQVLASASVTGHRAVAVPGTPAGLEALLRAHGSIALAEAVAPALDLAHGGFEVTPALQRAIRSRLDELRRDPGARDAFLVDGEPPEPGNLLVQRDLAATLRLLARRGAATFYTGELAQALVADMAENGGLLTARDLASYQPTWREPLRLRYRGHELRTMPLPSSGGIILGQVLSALERDRAFAREPHDLRSLHVFAEACRRAYAERARSLGDPAFLRAPVDGLLAPAALDGLYRSIDLKRATPSAALGSAAMTPAEPAHTTHLTVVDQKGNAVALTFTVNTVFGAAVVVPGTGVLLNNEMDDFALRPGVPNSFGLLGSEANAVAPAKIPLSSMAPTLVFEGDRLVLATGAAGGSTIPTTVLQILRGVLDHGMDVEQALAAPRVHHQWLPDELWYEPFGLDPETRRALAARGHRLVEHAPFGHATAVQRLPDGTLLGAADPRGEGLARGL